MNITSPDGEIRTIEVPMKRLEDDENGNLRFAIAEPSATVQALYFESMKKPEGWDEETSNDQ
ncbi:hypothetical protein SEA_ZOOMAN_180 [Microbacterium phage Zooman]|nr:hypothetical protein SEA_ZOOMAN_180 [Microbacterium phage Zooman]